MNENSYNILITGVNRGLGLAMAEIFVKKGHTVIAVNRNTSVAFQNLKMKFNNSLYIYQGDVTDEESIITAFKKISDEHKKIDILINNSAVHLDPERLPIEQVDFSVYLPTFQANSVGPLIVIKHGLKLVRKGNKKLIVNISSEAGSINDSWRESEFAYCMSKSALNMATSILHNYLKEERIKVLAVHPGWFSSDMGGARAPITPAKAAEKVTDLILKPFDKNEPIYIDPDGVKMEW